MKQSEINQHHAASVAPHHVNPCPGCGRTDIAIKNGKRRTHYTTKVSVRGRSVCTDGKVAK